MPDIELAIADGVARLTLNRAPVFNALSPELLEELLGHCTTLAADDTVKLVILEGDGEHFCAGADLPAFNARMASDPVGTADLGRRVTEALSSLPQITLAVLKGHCIGGAIVLSAVCDLRVAADSCRFAIPELDAGIPLSWGGTRHLVRLVGETLANDLILTCRPFDAAEALAAGFVTRIVPDDELDATVGEIAASITSKPAIVLRQTKRKALDIRAGTFDAHDDAADMLAATADEEAVTIGRAYIRRVLGK